MSNIFTLLPVIWQIVELIPVIREGWAGGVGGLLEMLKQHPGVIDLLQKIGAGLFPKLPADEQAAAGATMFDREQVRWLQAELNARNVVTLPLDVDGYYGKLTKRAVVAYQIQHGGLDADGWAGPLTVAALKEAV